jgi:hypothetical protein
MLTEKHLKTEGNSLKDTQNSHHREINKGYYLTRITEIGC